MSLIMKPFPNLSEKLALVQRMQHETEIIHDEVVVPSEPLSRQTVVRCWACNKTMTVSHDHSWGWLANRPHLPCEASQWSVFP